METRRLGNTDLRLTEIGLGTWAMGGGDWKFSWGPQDDEQSVRTIQRAMELGVNWIDTAPVYGLAANMELAEGLRQLAEARGKTAAHMAIAWVLRRPEVTAAIVGARKPSQVEETVGAAGWKLSPENLVAIDALLARRESIG